MICRSASLPFTNEVNLEIDAHEAGNMQLVIINAIGSKVLEQSLEIKKGSNKKVLLLNSSLPLGVYSIITQMNGRTSQFKLLKQ